MSEYSTIGKRLPRVDALEKITGDARFTDDLHLPAMLHGKILRSPYPHARILNVDISKAQKLSGVKAVATAEDTPDVKYGYFSLKDQSVFPKEKVRYVGEPVAAVAAVDEETANEALELIDVNYEQLPAVFDPLKAMGPDAPILHEKLATYENFPNAIHYGNVCVHVKIESGNVEEAFENADFVFEDTFRTERVHQCYIEPHVAIASFHMGGKLTVWVSVQLASVAHTILSELLKMPLNKIRVIVPHVGGGFGGKLGNSVLTQCVFLAKKANKPVKIRTTREEEFVSGRPRHPAVIELKTAVTKVGKILARRVKIVYDSGAYADHASGIAQWGAMHALGAYKTLNAKIDALNVYTNNVTTGGFRGYGNPQVTFAIESQMDIIARKLRLDPVEFRMTNALKDGDSLITGEILNGVGLSETIKKMTMNNIRQRPMGSKKWGRGIACSIMECGGMASAAMIKLNEDGTVVVYSGAPDIGMGSNTVLVQIAAEELGVNSEDVTMITTDTDTTPYDFGPCSDRTTYTTGNAVKMAAADAKRRLLEIASEIMEESIEHLATKNGRIYVKRSPEKWMEFSEVMRISHNVRGGPVIGRGSFYPESRPHDTRIVQGAPYGLSPSWSFSTVSAEVEVDIETGQVEVLNLTGVLDCGQPINLMGVEGQIQGAAAMGLGYCLMEGYLMDSGRVLNPNLIDYKVPTSLDVPFIRAEVIEGCDPAGPFGAKGGGQTVLCSTAPAIANAIYDAIGVRIKELPITPEKILRAVKRKAN